VRAGPVPAIIHEAVKDIARFAGVDLQIANESRSAAGRQIVAEPTERVERTQNGSTTAHIEAPRLNAGTSLPHQTQRPDEATAHSAAHNSRLVFNTSAAAHGAAQYSGVRSNVDALWSSARRATTTVSVTYGAPRAGIELTVLETFRPCSLDFEDRKSVV